MSDATMTLTTTETEKDCLCGKCLRDWTKEWNAQGAQIDLDAGYDEIADPSKHARRAEKGEECDICGEY